MNKIIINQYEITNPSIKEEKQIAFISDIHSDLIKLETIIKTLKELKITTLLIAGDVIDDTHSKENNSIKELLEELAKTVKIFIALGNHDMISYDKNSKEKSHEIKSNQKFWESLSQKENIFATKVPEDNPIIKKWHLDDIDISILNVPISYYWNGEKYEEFKKLLDEIEKIEIDTKKYNILLCHSPKSFGKSLIIKDYLEYLRNFNLILSGHMHGGLVPKFLRKKTYGGGFVGPYKTLFPKYSYGIIKDETQAILTTGGITKIATNKKLIRRLSSLIFTPELEIINLRPGDNKIEKTK